MISAGHALARALKAQGMPWVTGVSGESFLPFIDGLREVGLPFVQTVHESGATFLAVGFARSTGSPALVAVTRGPGVANALIGVHEAQQAGAPMVVIVGQVETSVRGRGVMQEVEVTDIFRSTAKAVHEVTRPERLVPAVCAALRESQLGRPGPVVVSVPSDLFFDLVDETALPTPGVTGRLFAGPLSGARLDDIARSMSLSRRGLIVAGADFANGRGMTRLAALAEATGFGVVGGHAYPDVLETATPRFLGASTVRSSRILRQALQQSDLIISLGHRLGDRTTQGYSALAGRLIAIDPFPSVGWDEYLNVELVAADPATAVAQLLSQLGSSSNTAAAADRMHWTSASRSGLDAERAAILERERRTASGVPFAFVVEALDRSLVAESSIVSDSGTFSEWIVRFLPFRDGRTYHGPISGAMGFSIGAAIGTQLARGGPRTVAMIGDGGFLMAGLELSTAVRLALPLTVIVFNNQIWGSIALHQDQKFPGKRHGVGLPAVSFAAIARGMGAEAFLASRSSDLESNLSRALHADGPAVLEVMTDPRRPSPAYYESDGPWGGSSDSTR